MHPELPYIAFIAAFIVLIPLPWHWRAGNVATLSIIAWLFVVNLIYGVDSAIWSDNVNIVAPVYCDISTKILIGANIALAAANMCVCIHLEQVASVRQALMTRAHKRRRQIFEGVMCYLVPMIWMALHYIVQGHRFDIIEEYGCRPTTYVSIPAIFLIWVPPLIMSTVASVFAGIALIHFWRRRVSFAKLLENSQSGLNPSRYLRLMVMALVEMVVGVAYTSFTLAFSVEWDMRPWTNWANVHWHFSQIDVYLTIFTPQFVQTYYYIIWWIAPASSFIFFLFFAFGQDALREYATCGAWLRSHVKLWTKTPSRLSVPRLRTLSSFQSVKAASSISSLPTVAAASYDTLASPLPAKLPVLESFPYERGLYATSLPSPTSSHEGTYAFSDATLTPYSAASFDKVLVSELPNRGSNEGKS